MKEPRMTTEPQHDLPFDQTPREEDLPVRQESGCTMPSIPALVDLAEGAGGIALEVVDNPDPNRMELRAYWETKIAELRKHVDQAREQVDVQAVEAHEQGAVVRIAQERLELANNKLLSASKVQAKAEHDLAMAEATLEFLRQHE